MSIKYMQLSEIRDEVADMIRDTGADRAVTIDRAINRKLMMVSARFNWQELSRTEYKLRSMKTVASITSDQTPAIVGWIPEGGVDAFETSMSVSEISGSQSLGFNMDQIYKISYVGQNNVLYDMVRLERDEFDVVSSANVDLEGSPEFWCMDGFTPMDQPLLAHATGHLINGSVSDVGYARIRYDTGVSENTDYGTYSHDDVLVPPEGVILPRTKPGWSVKSVSLDSSLKDTIASVYAYSTSSGSTTDKIMTFFKEEQGSAKGQSGRVRNSMKPLVKMWPNPETEFDMVIQYKESTMLLVSDADVPLIPVSGYLVEAATASIFENLRLHDIAQIHNNNAEQQVSAIIREQALGSTKVAVPIGARERGKNYYRSRR